MAGTIDKTIRGDIRVDFDVQRVTEEWKKLQRAPVRRRAKAKEEKVFKRGKIRVKPLQFDSAYSFLLSYTIPKKSRSAEIPAVVKTQVPIDKNSYNPQMMRQRLADFMPRRLEQKPAARPLAASPPPVRAAPPIRTPSSDSSPATPPPTRLPPATSPAPASLSSPIPNRYHNSSTPSYPVMTPPPIPPSSSSRLYDPTEEFDREEARRDSYRPVASARNDSDDLNNNAGSTSINGARQNSISEQFTNLTSLIQNQMSSISSTSSSSSSSSSARPNHANQQPNNTRDKAFNLPPPPPPSSSTSSSKKQKSEHVAKTPQQAAFMADLAKDIRKRVQRYAEENRLNLDKEQFKNIARSVTHHCYEKELTRKDSTMKLNSNTKNDALKYIERKVQKINKPS